MKLFADLYAALDRTTKTNEKVGALKRYLSQAQPEDAAWAERAQLGRYGVAETTIDVIDKVSCRPDFGIMAYSGYFKRKDKDVARVTTAKVEKIDLVSKVTANGKIQARLKVDLSALVMGQIVNLAVKEGDKVSKGQLLLQIDRFHRNGECSVSSHGVDRVGAQVHDDLVKLRRIADHHERYLWQ